MSPRQIRAVLAWYEAHPERVDEDIERNARLGRVAEPRMASLGVRLYTDEDVHTHLAGELRRRDYDVLGCHEAGLGNYGVPDEEQLRFATQQGRAILTFNTIDYVRLDVEWKRTDKSHAGLVVTPKIEDVGELLRRIMKHLDTTAPETQYDTLLWLA